MPELELLYAGSDDELLVVSGNDVQWAVSNWLHAMFGVAVPRDKVDVRLGEWGNKGAKAYIPTAVGGLADLPLVKALRDNGMDETNRRHARSYVKFSPPLPILCPCGNKMIMVFWHTSKHIETWVNRNVKIHCCNGGNGHVVLGEDDISSVMVTVAEAQRVRELLK